MSEIRVGRSAETHPFEGRICVSVRWINIMHTASLSILPSALSTMMSYNSRLSIKNGTSRSNLRDKIRTSWRLVLITISTKSGSTSKFLHFIIPGFQVRLLRQNFRVRQVVGTAFEVAVPTQSSGTPPGSVRTVRK
jgi:hypothetical protein